MESRLNHILNEKDHIFYGQVKDGQPTPPNLVIRLKNGNQLAYGYHYLAKELRYNPSEGIHLFFLDPDGTKTIHIEGRNLLSLWNGLVWHKVTFIREQDYNPIDDKDESELCVTAITISEIG